jgi:hypothetical protein
MQHQQPFTSETTTSCRATALCRYPPSHRSPAVAPPPAELPLFTTAFIKESHHFRPNHRATALRHGRRSLYLPWHRYQPSHRSPPLRYHAASAATFQRSHHFLLSHRSPPLPVKPPHTRLATRCSRASAFHHDRCIVSSRATEQQYLNRVCLRGIKVHTQAGVFNRVCQRHQGPYVSRSI